MLERIEQVVFSGDSLVVATNIISHTQIHADADGANRSVWVNRRSDTKANLVDAEEVLESKIYVCHVGKKGLRLARCLSLGTKPHNASRIVKLASILHGDDISRAVVVATESSVYAIPTVAPVDHDRDDANEGLAVRALVNIQKQRYEACLSRILDHDKKEGKGQGKGGGGGGGGGGAVLSRLSIDDQLSLFFSSRSSLLDFQREMWAIIPRLTKDQCSATLRHICIHLSHLDTTATTDVHNSSHKMILLMACKFVLLRIVACFESTDNDNMRHVGQPRLLLSFPSLFAVPGSDDAFMFTAANSNTNIVPDEKVSSSKRSEVTADNLVVSTIQELLSMCGDETSSSIDRVEMDSSSWIVAVQRAMNSTLRALALVVSDSALQKPPTPTPSQHKRSVDHHHHHHPDDSTTSDDGSMPEQQPALLPQLLLRLLGRSGDLRSPSAAAIFLSSSSPYYAASKRGLDNEIGVQNQSNSSTFTSLMLLFLEVTYERAKTLNETECEEAFWTAAIHVTSTDDINQAAFLLGNLLMQWVLKGLTAAAFEKRVLALLQVAPP